MRCCAVLCCTVALLCCAVLCCCVAVLLRCCTVLYCCVNVAAPSSGYNTSCYTTGLTPEGILRGCVLLVCHGGRSIPGASNVVPTQPPTSTASRAAVSIEAMDMTASTSTMENATAQALRPLSILRVLLVFERVLGVPPVSQAQTHRGCRPSGSRGLSCISDASTFSSSSISSRSYWSS